MTLARRLRNVVAVTALTAGGLVWSPAEARAHPRLVRSDPAAAARVGAVTLLRLWFSERPELRLTSLTLRDSAGTVIPLGPVGYEPNDRLGVRAGILEPLPAGGYVVEWRTAASDGHPVRGTFSFVLLPDARTATPDAARPVRPVDSLVVHPEASSASGLVSVAVRATTFASMLVLIGTLVFRYAVFTRARVASSLAHAILSRVATVGVVAAGLLLLSSIARLLLQQAVFSRELGPGASLTTIDILADTRWGHAWLVQVAATLIALSASIGARKWISAWPIAAGAVLVLSATPALSGHAAATARMTGVAVLSDALHILAASGWLGSLFVLTAVAIPVVMLVGVEAERWSTIASLVNAFSPTALICAGVLVLTGIVAASLHVGSLGALWFSQYGRTLLLKVAVLLPLAATGAYNWRRVRPALGTAAATTRLRTSASVELAIGVLVLCVTSVLAATEPPIQ